MSLTAGPAASDAGAGLDEAGTAAASAPEPATDASAALGLLSDAGVARSPVERPGALRQTGAHLLFAAGVVASSLLAVGLVYLPARGYFDVVGRPEPLVGTITFVPAGALKIAVSYWLLPELYRAGGGTPDIEATRQTMWRWVRWPALTAALGVVACIVGAALEREAFGRGQLLMAVGFSGVALSHTAFDILSIVASSYGYRH
ncbi:MAG: hypothetical protein IPJ65_07380 [Archangiaceae bacterium]|nr:hypothetical protein [Archangiaceae bacterium]